MGRKTLVYHSSFVLQQRHNIMGKEPFGYSLQKCNFDLYIFNLSQMKQEFVVTHRYTALQETGINLTDRQ
jgi:hypothetical protein